MPRGRPKKEIDRVQFEKLCGIMCTLGEIAGWFDCAEDTIERWCKREYKKGFKEVFDAKSAAGKISLRRYQFELAKKNASMSIWLGKQYLGQRDTIVYEDATEDTTETDEEIYGETEAV